MRPEPPSNVSAQALEPTVWLVSCAAASGNGEITEALQDACLKALDSGALLLDVDLTDAGRVSIDTVEVLVIVAEILASREGCLWLSRRDIATGGRRTLPLSPRMRHVARKMVEQGRRAAPSGGVHA
jgi:hypothetical protein